MDLVLWRHADAEEGSGHCLPMNDLDRELTQKGYRQANKVSRWMKKRLDPTARILASPARRTRETADCLGVNYEVEDLLYQGSPGKILEFLRWPESQSSTVIVGHQPTLGRLASLILTGEEFPLVLEKGALWWFRWKRGDAAGGSVLIAAISPGFLLEDPSGKRKTFES